MAQIYLTMGQFETSKRLFSAALEYLNVTHEGESDDLTFFQLLSGLATSCHQTRVLAKAEEALQSALKIAESCHGHMSDEAVETATLLRTIRDEIVGESDNHRRALIASTGSKLNDSLYRSGVPDSSKSTPVATTSSLRESITEFQTRNRPTLATEARRQEQFNTFFSMSNLASNFWREAEELRVQMDPSLKDCAPPTWAASEAQVVLLRNKIMASLLLKDDADFSENQEHDASFNENQEQPHRFEVLREEILILGYVIGGVPVSVSHEEYLREICREPALPREKEEREIQLERMRNGYLKLCYIIAGVPISSRHIEYLAAVRQDQSLPSDQAEFQTLEGLHLLRKRLLYIVAGIPVNSRHDEYLVEVRGERVFPGDKLEFQELGRLAKRYRALCYIFAGVPVNSRHEEYLLAIHGEQVLPRDEVEFQALDRLAEKYHEFCCSVAEVPIDSRHEKYLAAVYRGKVLPNKEAEREEFKELDHLADGYLKYGYIIARFPINSRHEEYLAGKQVPIKEEAEFEELDRLADLYRDWL
jgi:hypothetical protein